MSELQQLRSEFSQRFTGIEEKLDDMRTAVEQLIRVDGELKRHQDALSRIGGQVDRVDERVRDIEVRRLPAIEAGGAAVNATTKHHANFNSRLVALWSAIISGLVVAGVMYLATH